MQLIHIWTNLHLTLVFMMAMEVGILSLCLIILFFVSMLIFINSKETSFLFFCYQILIYYFGLESHHWSCTCKLFRRKFISLLRKLGGFKCLILSEACSFQFLSFLRNPFLEWEQKHNTNYNYFKLVMDLKYY